MPPSTPSTRPTSPSGPTPPTATSSAACSTDDFVIASGAQPAVAHSDSDHQYLVAYTAGSGGFSLLGQLVDDEGATIGSPFPLAATTVTAYQPRAIWLVATDYFLVLYQDYGGGLYGQFVLGGVPVDAAGTPGLAPLPFAASGSDPALVFDAYSNRLVIAWDTGTELHAQLADGDYGTLIGPDLTVATAASYLRGPSLSDHDGVVSVVFVGTEDGTSDYVHMQAIDADLDALTGGVLDLAANPGVDAVASGPLAPAGTSVAAWTFAFGGSREADVRSYTDAASALGSPTVLDSAGDTGPMLTPNTVVGDLLFGSMTTSGGTDYEPFFTIVSIDPAPDPALAVIDHQPTGSGIATDALVSVELNGEPDAATAAGFGIDGVAGTTTAGVFTLTFIPSAPLAPGTTYTARVAASVADSHGHTLGAPYTWTFTTAGAPLPDAGVVDGSIVDVTIGGESLSCDVTGTFIDAGTDKGGGGCGCRATGGRPSILALLAALAGLLVLGTRRRR